MLQDGVAHDGANWSHNQFGDLERCALRSGNVHSAHGWQDVLEPVVAPYRCNFKRRLFRADAARTSRLSCRKTGKARILCQIGSHPGNPSLIICHALRGMFYS
jgi:hypothetical protein